MFAVAEDATMRYLTLLTFLVACDPTGVEGGSNDEWEPVAFVDEGDACLGSRRIGGSPLHATRSRIM